MKRAYEARLSGALPLKHFTALKTAAILQRERLESARFSPAAMQLLKEVETTSEARLRFLAWACYGNNRPDHPIHKLVRQEAGKSGMPSSIASKPCRENWRREKSWRPAAKPMQAKRSLAEMLQAQEKSWERAFSFLTEVLGFSMTAEMKSGA